MLKAKIGQLKPEIAKSQTGPAVFRLFRVRPIDWKVFPNKLGQVDRL
jgi:hypothetical protein